MIKVLLVEDRKMSRDSIIGYMKGSDRYELAAQTASAGMAEMLCMQCHIDLVLMDVCTANNEDGIEAAAVIKRHFPNIKVIIVTGMTTIDLIDRARAAKADSFWYKEQGDISLLEICDRTMKGNFVWPDRTPVVQIGLARSDELTARELEVIRALAQGYRYEEIAEQLYVSPNTVKYHVKNILQKTGFRSTVQLVADVVEKRLILPRY